MATIESPEIGRAALDDVVAFHGHLCPGLTMGMQAARIALREIGPNSKEQEVMAVVETDMCGVDAIQFFTSCTFGKGNLVHLDYGKNAYTFFRSTDGKAVRIAGRPDAFGFDPAFQALRAKVSDGEATPEERERYRQEFERRALALLDADPDDLYTVTEVHEPAPKRDRSRTTVLCAACGEAASQSRTHRLGDRDLCTPCFETATATT